MVRFRRDLTFGALLLSCLAGAQVGPLLTKGQQALDQGRYSVALRVGTEAVAKGPRVWQAHRLVARAAVGMDQPDRAEKGFKEAIRLAPVAVKAGLQGELKEVAALRRALVSVARSETLRKADDLTESAKSLEDAYDLMPKRYAYGIDAAELFEKAGLLEDARRMLDEVRGRTLPSKVAENVKARLEAVLTKIDAMREAARLEAERKEAEARKAEEARLAAERKRAEEAERKRIEEERRQEEERLRAERERQIREEKERLERLLSDFKSDLSSAESDLRQANGRVSEEERRVRETDGDADRARSRRDSAKREVEDWKDKVESAKTEVAKDVYRTGLRAAEAKYDDARGDYERANRRYEDAKSRLSQAQGEVDSARRRLDMARQGVSDTESALLRLGSG